MSLFETSPRLALPLLMASQAQKHLTHNEALVLLETLVQPVVQDMAAQAPPDAPAAADCVIVGPGATGTFAGEEGKLAAFIADAWHFFAPQLGWTVVLAASGQAYVYGATGWSELPAPLVQANRRQIGINATASDTNRLTVASDATLLNAESASHRLTINKAGPSATASLVFQSGWSGRAEMGLAGDDGFSIKVSADGGSWTTALTVDPHTGHVALPARAAATAYLDGGTRSFSAGTTMGFDGLTHARGGLALGSGLSVGHGGLYAIALTLTGTQLGATSVLVGGQAAKRFEAKLTGSSPTTVSFSALLALSAGDEISLRFDDAATLTCGADNTWLDCMAI